MRALMSPTIPESSLNAIKACEGDVTALRQATLAERAAMLDQACIAALELEQARIAAGMPPSQPAPWPASTWEFLAKAAADVRARAPEHAPDRR
jgi:hypothetical protein